MSLSWLYPRSLFSGSLPWRPALLRAHGINTRSCGEPQHNLNTNVKHVQCDFFLPDTSCSRQKGQEDFMIRNGKQFPRALLSLADTCQFHPQECNRKQRSRWGHNSHLPQSTCRGVVSACAYNNSKDSGWCLLSTYKRLGTVPSALHTSIHLLWRLPCEVGTITTHFTARKLRPREVRNIPTVTYNQWAGRDSKLGLWSKNLLSPQHCRGRCHIYRPHLPAQWWSPWTGSTVQGHLGQGL